MEMIRAGDTEWDHKGRTMISQIYISYNNLFITSIRFGYLENGTLVLSDKYGPSDGHSFRVVTLNENEYVTGLSGAQGKCGGIRNLTFHTNCGKHGPFGHDGIDASFIKIEIDPGIRDRRQFGGFFGSYRDECVSGIGLYFSPILSSQRVVEDENM
ncbi:hypothetical protein AALP_AA2G223000 [Arabis alpina]|uniref:Jacalin-type lectin domain-containing protein n=1 Tax=Arabis alpina TaxID=50452 RepID=A0A087HJ86_ARAAL|nr:hypothetical protein AALP_AA2G223000 [Arabis alpina]